MKRILSYCTAIFIGLCTIISCTKTNSPNPDENPNDTITNEVIDLKSSTEQIVQSDNEFGLDIFQRIVNDDTENKNIFISPTSISLALAMTYNGADGDTKTAMETTLKKQGLSVAAINVTYKSLMDSLINTDDKVLLTIANSIFYRQEFPVKQAFIDSNTINYNAEVTPLDFSNPASVDIINTWVADKTNDKITTIVDAISPETVMYLLNAIYFKGIWKYEFDSEKTTNKNFTLASGSIIQVPTMQQKENFGYYENTNMQMLKLPYGSGDYNMIVLLPNINSSISNLVSSLTPNNWNTWTSNLVTQEVNVELPKFTFDFESTLNDYLKAMGMTPAFTASVANFSKITDNNNICISNVKHKTFVEVNEEGTEAAAVTSVEIVVTSVPTTKYFAVNRPFVFAIQEKNTNAIVFIGRVMNPLEE